jgi:hypothetical protein
VKGVSSKSDTDADAYAEEDGKVAEAADVQKEGEKAGKGDQRAEKNVTEEAEAEAEAEGESNEGQRGGEEPKWTPLKEAGEREVSNDLMDHDSLPD